ncbi:MAG: hypothetical protein VW397_03115 [Candidatus Margulisiibacteriota bacterium]
MLESLQLKNFILVENMVIDFKSGFNVITGETGAGKSLIIKSLSLLAGQMASSSVIYPEKESAFIEATFVVPESLRLPPEILDGDRLTVSRRIFKSKPCVNKLNFESVSLKVFKDVMSKLIFITSQHQVVELMDSSNHIDMFDVYMDATAQQLLSDYRQAYQRYLMLVEKQRKFDHDQSHLKKELLELEMLVQDVDLQLFQRGEEDKLHSDQKECEVLQERKQLVDQIRSVADDSISKLTHLDQLMITFSQLKSKSVALDNDSIIEQLNTLHYSMTQESLEIEYLEAIDLDEVNARLNQIFKAKVKYNVNALDSLLDKAEAAKHKIKELNEILENATAMDLSVQQSYEVAFKLAQSLSQKRRELKAQFVFVIVNQLKQLGMINVKFDVEFSDIDSLSAHGIDRLEFTFSGNPNMPLNSLKRIASGGELSRVMLALIMGHAAVLKQPLLILDEIDVGVGGITANYMGNVLQGLGDGYQLLVVTHLPQIARCANAHFRIIKTVKDDQSYVKIEEIRKEDVSRELQRMVGGDVVASLIK